MNSIPWKVGWIRDHLYWWYIGVCQEAKEHAEHLKYVLSMFWKNQLFANKVKNEFAQEEMDFLGYILSWKGVRLDPIKLETIQD
jgi:hypothetical protein